MRHRRPRRPLHWLLAALAIAVLAVAVGAVVTAAIKPDLVEAQIKQQALPRLSRSLGRPVQVSEVRLRWFPPSVELSDLRVGGRPGEPPLLVVPRARASVRLWTLLMSGGHEVSLRSATLQSPRINLVRERDGTWSHQGLGGGAGGSGTEALVSDLRIRDGALYVVDRSGPRPDEAVAMRRIDLRARDVGGSALRLELSAALASDQTNFRARLAHARKTWEGTLKLDALPISSLRGLLPAGLDAAVTGGAIAVQATLSTRPDEVPQVSGHLHAPGLMLRGAPANADFDFIARLPSGGAARPEVDIRNLRLKGPGVVDLGGEATLRGDPTTAQFSLSGPLLNLDALMAALPPPPKSGEAPDNTGGAVPAALRASIARIGARGTIRVDTLTVKKLSAQHVVADVQLEAGVVTVDRATADLYGGSMAATGSRLDLREPLPVWDLEGEIEGVSLDMAMQQVSGKSPLAGSVDGHVVLHGQGDQWATLQHTMTGKGAFKVNDGVLKTADLAQMISGPIGEAMKIVGKSSALARGGSGAPQSTTLHGLQGEFTVANGRMVFSRPISVRSNFGDLSLTGSVGLDQQLDLKGTAQLAPSFLSAAAGVDPGKPIAAPLEVTGSLGAPQVRIDSGAVAKGMLRQSPPGKVFHGLRGMFGGGSQ